MGDGFQESGEDSPGEAQLLVSTLGGSWGRTELEERYEFFERAIFGAVQKADESNDSYLSRHDVNFEELIAKRTTQDEVRAYILLRRSKLSSDDRKRLVVESKGTLEYQQVSSGIRLLGSRFFTDLQGQGQKASHRNKVYDVNMVEEPPDELPGIYHAASGMPEEAEPDLDNDFMETMLAAGDSDAHVVQSFEEELESFFQDTDGMQEALVSYVEARARLLQKRKSRGFWPVAQGSSSGSSGSKGKGGRFGGKGGGKSKSRSSKDQLLLRISRSHCRNCGQKGHWKAERPQKSAPGNNNTAPRSDASASVAIPEDGELDEVLAEPPAESQSLEEACTACLDLTASTIRSRLTRLVANLQTLKVSPNRDVSTRRPFRKSSRTTREKQPEVP